MMLVTMYECLLYALIVISLGSYAAAFSVRWPEKQMYFWEKEAHKLLSLPFNKTLPNHLKASCSHCLQCNHRLAWQDLLPILSFALLRGRCRYCTQNISYRYPAIEALHLVCCFPLLWLTEDIYTLTLLTLLMSSLLTAAAIDVTHHLIPDECNGIIVLCGLLLSLDKNTLESSVLGMIVGYSLIFIVAIVYQKIRGKEGIGLGDAKLLAGLGAWLGIECIPTLLLGASSLGILYTIALNKGFSRYIAFGPCLIFSSIMMFYW